MSNYLYLHPYNFYSWAFICSCRINRTNLNLSHHWKPLKYLKRTTMLYWLSIAAYPIITLSQIYVLNHPISDLKQHLLQFLQIKALLGPLPWEGLSQAKTETSSQGYGLLSRIHPGRIYAQAPWCCWKDSAPHELMDREPVSSILCWLKFALGSLPCGPLQYGSLPHQH